MDEPSERVIMMDGTFVEKWKLQKGDVLMGDDSTARTIQTIEKSLQKVYKITPFYTPEESFEVGEEEIICLKYNTIPSQIQLEKGPYPRYKCRYADICGHTYKGITLHQVKITTKNFSMTERLEEDAYAQANAFREALLENYTDPYHEAPMKDYVKYSNTFKHRLVLYRSEGIKFPARKVEIDPYLLGVWLGDGTSDDTSITTIDKEILDYLKEESKKLGLECKKRSSKKEDDITYRICYETKNKGKNVFLNFLKEKNLIKNKHIPDEYKINSREVRLKVLAGLIDTDGYYGNDSLYEITQKNKRLAEDIVFLARSLGFWCHIRPVEKGCWYKGEYKKGIYQKVSFGGMGLDKIPVLLPRKKAKKQFTKKQKNFLYTKFSVEEIGEREIITFTFKERPGRYLLENFMEMLAC